VLQARQAARATAVSAAAKAAKAAGKNGAAGSAGSAGGWPQPTIVVPTPANGDTANGEGTEGDTAVEEAATAAELSLEGDVAAAHGLFAKPSLRTKPGITAIGAVTGGKVAVEGKVRVVEIRPVERNSVLAVEINDTTGYLTAMFYGRSHIPGLICGARVKFSGSVGLKGGHPVMINPKYELVSPGEE
jgi:hypothetical protein